MYSGVARLVGLVSVKETDSHIIVNGIPGLRFARDVYNHWKTSKINNYMFSAINKSQVKFPKFFAIEVLYMLEQLVESRRTYVSRRILLKTIDELKNKTWLNKIGAQDFKSRLDLSRLKDLNVTLFAHQDKFLREYDRTVWEYSLKGMLMDVAAGGGKAQPLDAKIKIPGGWTTMGDIRIGSQIIAPDGTTVPVIGVFPQGVKDIYEVEFWDGRKTRACGEHLWESFDGTVRDPHRWATRDTLEMKRLLEKNRQRLYIPLIEAEDGPGLDLPADPYLIGALIGDGGLRYNVRFSCADEDVIAEVRKVLPEYTTLKHVNEYDYTVIDERRNKNALTDIIRDLGLFGKYSFEKFVPEIYKNGSRQQRLSVLQGLMDTDGTINDHAVASFCTTSEQLALDVQYLVRSLGGIARISEKRTRYTHNGKVREGKVAYNVNIRYKKQSELFRMERKKARCKDNGQYAEGLKLRVKAITLVGQEEAQCIMVDHPKHLYVTDDFIVTHNTITLYALGHCLIDCDTQFYICPKNSAVDVWEKTIAKQQPVYGNAHFFKSGVPEYWSSMHGIAPTLGKKIYIVHYDYLANFLAFVKANPKAFGKVFVGIDESHNFNEESQRTANLIELCSVTNATNVVHASGTPLKAMGSEAITLLSTICDDFTQDARTSFRKIFGKEAKRANEILANRIGIVSFKVPKQQIETPGVDYHEVKIKIKNGNDYTLDSIRQKMTTFIDERLKFYQKGMPEYQKLYDQCLDMHSRSLRSSQDQKNFQVYKDYIKQIRRGYDPATMKDMVMYCNRYELKNIVPSLPDAYRKPFINVRAIIKYVDLKVLGEALSQVLGKLRIQCHLDMLPEMPLDDLIDNALKKTVIFTSYVEVVKELEQALPKAGYKPLFVYGETNKDLPAIIKKFHEDPDANPLVATFKSLSTAVPLTAANTIVATNAPFRDYEWTQTIARIDRIGQDQRCHAFTLLLDTGEAANISTRSKDIMAWSKEQVSQILGVEAPDDVETTLESLMEQPTVTVENAEQFIEMLRKKLPIDVV